MHTRPTIMGLGGLTEERKKKEMKLGGGNIVINTRGAGGENIGWI